MGVLLFVNDDERQIAQYIHRRTRSGELTTNQRLAGPGLSSLLKCVELIDSPKVRTQLEVDTPTASRILGDLVEREVLVKTSTAQRGPAVTHGPGPQFPTEAPEDQ